MRATWMVTAAVLAVCFARALGAAPAPDPATRPAQRWEYGELEFFRRASGRGGVGGGAAPARVVARWTTAGGEVEATSWEDLAQKMKAAPARKDASESAQRLRVLNHLGGEGWELTGLARDATRSVDVWTFKRRLEK